jgi:hypothetical protein
VCVCGGGGGWRRLWLTAARTTREGSGGGWAAEPAQEGEGGCRGPGLVGPRAWSGRKGSGEGRERKGFPFFNLFSK